MGLQKKMIASVLLALAGGLCAQADTWYAAAAHFGQGGMDGRTPETAFGTIQEAVDQAKKGDTVLVAEGVYDQGTPTCAPGAMDARVSITNKITLRASGRKEQTVIVGRHASTSTGVGSDAIRCVYIDAELTGVIVRGFTLRDGGVRESSGSSAAGCSGGVYAGTHYSLGDLIIDCDIFNCIGSRGGAVKGGVSVRCRFVGNSCDYTGAIGRDAAFWNCLFVGNGRKPNLFEACRLVNCTVIGNASAVFSSDTYAVNVICADNDTLNCRSDMKTCKGSVFGLPNSAGASLAGGMENVVCDETADYAVIAPLFGDFRVVKGHPAETSGRLAYMTEANIHGSIPAEERYLDLNGNPIVETDGSICAGCLQETAERATTGGGIQGKGVGKWSVLGYPNTMTNLWAFPSTYPSLVKIDQFKDRDILAFELDELGLEGFRLPLLDGTFYVMPPVARSGLVSVEPLFATQVVYVDRNKGSDTTGDGTAQAPYASLQAGVDAAPHYGLVRCAAGTYDNGSRAVDGFPCRVSFDNLNRVIFLRGAGADSVIVGQRTTGGDYGGCGADSMRCISMDGVSFVQGFTVREGSTTVAGGSSGQGGAIRAPNTRCGFADLIIEDCGGYSGVIYGGALQRCLIRNCAAWRPLVRASRWVSSCDFENNQVAEWGILFYEYPVYDTTLRCSAGGTTAYPNGQLIYNSIITGASQIPAISGQKYPDGYPGCLVWGCSSHSVTEAEAHYLRMDPKFAPGSDGRLLPESPAFGTAGATISSEDLWQTNYHLFVSTDLKGRPRQFVNGKAVPGAYAWPVTKVSVSAPLVGSTTQGGDTYLYRDETLTVTYSQDADPAKARHFLGYATNGVIASSAASYTFPPVPAGAVYAVTPVVSTNWYVNATDGDDARDGFTPATAKRTLRAIMEDVYMLSGDCVHAAEGDYNEGTMFPKNGLAWGGLEMTTNRVVINAGVSLVADGAKERTIIRGIKGNVSAGCGPGALRCVYMYLGTLLKGFTLADGATATHAAPSGSAFDDYSGGGVLTYGVDATAYVENCVFTNCSARNGGGAFGGYMVKCRFTDCKAANTGSALRNSWRIFGCVIESGEANGPYGVVDSCTFGPSARLSDFGGSVAGNYSIKNSLILGTVSPSSSRKFSVVNSLFSDTSGLQTGIDAGYVNKDTASQIVSADQIAVDAAFMPVKDSLAVDTGVNGTIPSQLHGRDALGHQRIFNRTVDIGAIEYDWRRDFTAALDDPRLTVTEASPNVTLSDGKVRLSDGDALTAVLTDLRPDSTRRFAVEIAGAGELSATLNDETPVVWAATDSGTKRYRSPETSDTLSFTFGGDGSADLSAFSCNPGLGLFIR